MPQLVICHKCGAVLYESMELKSPDEIIQSYDSKCPTCGKILSLIPKYFEVKLADETKRSGLLEPEKKRPSRKESRNKHEKNRVHRKADYMRKRELKNTKKVHASKKKKHGSIDYVYSWPFFANVS